MSFNTALITGGGGGIGKAMAKYFISQGKKVIIVGRTEKNLQQAVKELGHGTTYYGSCFQSFNLFLTTSLKVITSIMISKQKQFLDFHYNRDSLTHLPSPRHR